MSTENTDSLTNSNASDKNSIIHEALLKKHKNITSSITYLTGNWMYLMTDSFGNPIEINRFEYLGCFDNNDILTFNEFCKEFTLLDKLKILNISLSEQVTSIPKEISNMHNLRTLVLADCEATVEMPDEFYKLTNLNHLVISDSEKIIVDLTKICNNMTELEALKLEDSGLNGNIPSEIGNLTKLTDLSLCDNKDMCGPIPDEILNLTNLYELNLSDSNLNGVNFLERLCNSNIVKLRDLVLTRTGLTGRIPENINKYNHRMRFLYIDDNQLTGNIPQTLYNAMHKNSIDCIRLSKNNLTGSIPENIKSYIEDRDNLTLK